MIQGRKPYSSSFAAMGAMPQFNKNTFALAQRGRFSRQEILINEHSQLVLMKDVQSNDDTGEEIHSADRLLLFLAGEGETLLNGGNCHGRAEIRTLPSPAHFASTSTGSWWIKTSASGRATRISAATAAAIAWA